MSLKTMYAATFLTAALVAGALACVSPRPAAAQATKLVYALPTTVPDEPFGSLDAQPGCACRSFSSPSGANTRKRSCS
jgi:hypothetical protein